jgi:hypothetical protein
MLSASGFLLVTGCVEPVPVVDVTSEAFVLLSPAFVEGGVIPTRYTGDGENISPPLEWRGVPEGTLSLALTLVDPDVPWGQDVPVYGTMPPPGTQPADLFVHWIVTDIPPTTASLADGASPGNMPQGLGELATSFALFGGPANQYGGPAPPPGTKAHAYRFTLYALDVGLGVATLTGYFGH